MQIPTPIRPLAAALACGLALSACGGNDDPTGEPAADRQKANRDAMLAYAKCMREHGVDMPDPKFNGSGGAVAAQRAPQGEAEKEKFDKANRACGAAFG